jgi:hypothetical protein
MESNFIDHFHYTTDFHKTIGCKQKFIDWLVFSANICNISAILCCEQILYKLKTPTWPLEITNKNNEKTNQ